MANNSDKKYIKIVYFTDRRVKTKIQSTKNTSAVRKKVLNDNNITCQRNKKQLSTTIKRKIFTKLPSCHCLYVTLSPLQLIHDSKGNFKLNCQ